MPGEIAPRATPAPRERLLALIDDPITPATWRGRALGPCAALANDPTDSAAHDLCAANLFHALWSHLCRVERIVHAARDEPGGPEWRGDARALLDQLERGEQP